MQFVIKRSVNYPGVPLTTTKPRLDGRIVGGTTTTIQSHPFQVWLLHSVQFDDRFEVPEQQRLPEFIMTNV
jgi:hypothetical protein